MLGRLTHRAIERAGGVLGVTSEDYTYDSLGHLTGATDNAGISLAFAYDSHSRLVSESQDGRAVASIYDTNGNRIALDMPSGRSVSYYYDAIDRMTSIIMDADANHLADYTYMGTHLIRMSRGNGIRTDRSYDAIGRLASISTEASTISENLRFSRSPEKG